MPSALPVHSFPLLPIPRFCVLFKECFNVTDDGKLFHAFAAATEKARSPMVICLVTGARSDAAIAVQQC